MTGRQARKLPVYIQPRSLDVQASNSTSLLLKVKLFNFSLFHNLGRCVSFEKEVKPGFFSFKYLFLQLYIFISIPNHFLYHNFILTLAGLQPRPVNKYLQVWSERSWFHIHLDVFKKNEWSKFLFWWIFFIKNVKKNYEFLTHSLQKHMYYRLTKTAIKNHG